MVRTGVMADASEVRWDIRPAPLWGTIEVRACDGMSTLPELASVAALVQVLVEHFSRRLDEGHELPELRLCSHRENKWRAARYRLEARVIIDDRGMQRPVREHLTEVLNDLALVAADLGCGREFDRAGVIFVRRRQLCTPAVRRGSLRRRPRRGGPALIREFRSGPESSLSR